jgi:hypothetical protein
MSHRDNWFMHPPHSNWLEAIVSLVCHLTKVGEDARTIKSIVNRHPPSLGWTKDTASIAQLLVKIAPDCVEAKPKS